MQRIPLALLTSLCLTAALCAFEVKSTRIDIEGAPGKIEYTNLSVVSTTGQVAIHGWDKVNGKYRLYSELTLATNGWKQVGIRFTPLSNGTLQLVLSGVWKQTEDKKGLIPLPVYYDLVEVQGTTIQNGDFEELDEKGNPKSWNAPGPLKNADDFLVAKDKAKSGKVSVRCWQNQRLTQNLVVKAGTPVTITVWALPAR